jgi:hypothetical protein
MNKEENQETELKDYQLFEYAIERFTLEIDSLAESLPLVMGLVEFKLKNHNKKLDKFIDQHKDKDENGEKLYRIPLDKFNEFNKLDKDAKTSRAAYNILPRNFVVSLVSQYDAYLADLCRSLFQIKPELAFLLEKEFTFQDILKYEDLEELKEYVIEKDVESLLRKSHYEQLTTLEKRISKHTKKEFTLTTNLPALPTFIELTERRNLFVHCNGLVSRNYIENCKKHKVKTIEKIELNDVLDVDPEYFNDGFQAVFEIGVKLGQVLWRKFLPTKINEADYNLNNISFDLIINGYYDLAINLLKFATETLPKKSTEKMRKTMIINKALSFYLKGEKGTSNKILNSEDWSVGLVFQLGVSVLKEDYELSTSLMNKIGPEHDDINASSYQEWPLFRDFRDTDKFKNTFKEIFDKEFVEVEREKKSFVKLMNDIKDEKTTAKKSNKK